MKKNLNLILLGGSLFLSALIFALMAAPGVTVTILGATGKASVCDCLENTGTLIAFILFIVAFLALAFALCVDLLKIKFDFNMFLALGAALLLLVAGILFFCTASINGGGDLGIGAIFCGILAILAAGGSCLYGLVAAKVVKL